MHINLTKCKRIEDSTKACSRSEGLKKKEWTEFRKRKHAPYLKDNAVFHEI